MMNRNRLLEQNLATIRRLIRCAERLAQVVQGTRHEDDVQEAIAEGEYLLKVLGGVPTRSAAVAPSRALAAPLM